jgi:pimeloyl-ACP methyl ester carboxylesterase
MRNRPSFEHVLVNSTVPVLIIAGQNDPVIDVKALEEQAKLSDKIRFYSIQNVGHMGLFEAENETIQLVNDFAKLVKSKLSATD